MLILVLLVLAFVFMAGLAGWSVIVAIGADGHVARGVRTGCMT